MKCIDNRDCKRKLSDTELKHFLVSFMVSRSRYCVL